MYTGKLGVGVISWERLYLLAKLVTDLERQTWLENTTFHLFNDGHTCKFTGSQLINPEKIDRAKILWDQADIPKGESQFRDLNVGVGLHQKNAYDWMCDRYEYIVMLENDIRVSPYYLRLARVGFSDVINANEDISVFSLGYKKDCNEIQGNLNSWNMGWVHWWDAIFKSDMWRQILPELEEYYSLINDRPYEDRPNKEIKRLHEQKGVEFKGTSQDYAKGMALKSLGKKRAKTVVNRVFYTGVKGVHSSRDWYENHDYKDAKPYVFDRDAFISCFERLRGN
jgi:hypothetical protein